MLDGKKGEKCTPVQKCTRVQKKGGKTAREVRIAAQFELDDFCFFIFKSQLKIAVKCDDVML